MGKMTEGTVPVPPYRPCARRSDDDVFPVQRVSHAGEPSGWGEIPVERLAMLNSEKVVFRENVE